MDELALSFASWNFIGHDPKEFRHYGPMARDFFAVFGHDGLVCYVGIQVGGAGVSTEPIYPDNREKGLNGVTDN